MFGKKKNNIKFSIIASASVVASLIIISFIGYLAFGIQNKKPYQFGNSFLSPFPSQPASVSTLHPLTAARKKSAAVSGRQEYSIVTMNNSPNFTKAIIDPEDVKLGQKQTMTVYLKDEKAPITEVVAEIQTDTMLLEYPLSLISGTDRDGVWQSSWVVQDTHDTTYVTRFVAKNSLGETGEARLSWTDPGCGCTGSDCTVSTTCTVSGVDGADGGTLTISGGGITVGADSTLLAGTLNVSGGSLLASNTNSVVDIDAANTICMTDADSDNYPVDTTQIAKCTSGRRRYLMTSISTVDCYDSNANAYPTSAYCGTADRGDASFDYNCSGTTTTCGTIFYPSYSQAKYTCNKYEVCTSPSSVACLNTSSAVSCGASTGYTNDAGNVVYRNCSGCGGGSSLSCPNPGTAGTQACQ